MITTTTDTNIPKVSKSFFKLYQYAVGIFKREEKRYYIFEIKWTLFLDNLKNFRT